MPSKTLIIRGSAHQPSSETIDPSWLGGNPTARPDVFDLGSLYRCQGNLVLHWLGRLGVARQDLSDLRHEVFLAILEQRDNFEHRSAVSTWLFSICRNVVGNHLRRRTRVARAPNQIVDYAAPADEFYESKQRDSLVRQAISAMTPDHRMVVQLLDLQELTYVEVARQIGVRVPALRVLRHRAHKELAQRVHREPTERVPRKRDRRESY